MLCQLFDIASYSAPNASPSPLLHLQVRAVLLLWQPRDCCEDQAGEHLFEVQGEGGEEAAV